MQANRWLCLLLAICLIFTLTACSGGGGGSDTSADNGGNGDDPAGGGGNGGGNSAPAGPWLCFTATGLSTVSMAKVGTLDTIPTLEFSKDGSDWEDFVIGTTTVKLADGEKVYLRAKNINNSFSKDSFNYAKFVMAGSIAASGNIMSLLDKESTSVEIPNTYCFAFLFRECIALSSAPIIPATTLTPYCYFAMFAGCTNLVVVPDLPATTLANDCYKAMFSECSSLTTAPKLPAVSLADRCYVHMFDECPNLSSITVYFTTWDEICTMDWVNGVAAIGEFHCPGTLPDEVSANDKKPSGWTKVPLP